MGKWQFGKASKQAKAKQQNSRVTRIAHALWQERNRDNKPEPSPEEAAKLAAIKDWEMAEKIADNPLRQLDWIARKQIKNFQRSQAPTIRLLRFFLWEIPKWNITAIRLFLQSDIVKLLAVPIVAAILTTVSTVNERREREQVETFDEYLNQIDTLTFEHGLLTAEPSPGAVLLARGRTIAALRKLDLKRRQELIAFIQASGLNQGEDVVISFAEANLQGIDLRGTDLSYFNFQGAFLGRANLKGASLRESNLEGASLDYANLEGSSLVGANLEGASLWESNLKGAELFGKANLKGAQFVRANLEKTLLWGANLKGANLGSVNLKGAQLLSANLEDTALSGANLKGAYLNEANLKGANLARVNLERADLEDANLEGAYLLGANFEGSNLEDVNLNNVYYCNTTMPDGTIRDDHCEEDWPLPSN